MQVGGFVRCDLGFPCVVSVDVVHARHHLDDYICVCSLLPECSACLFNHCVVLGLVGGG